MSWELWSSTRPRAKADRFCESCGRRIAKGETYLYGKGRWEGEWATYSQCSQCSWAIGYVCRTAGIDPEDVYDMHEDLRVLAQDAKGDFAEFCRAGRIYAWSRRKWMRADGNPIAVDVLRELSQQVPG